jgi:hypothetical protein
MVIFVRFVGCRGGLSVAQLHSKFGIRKPNRSLVLTRLRAKCSTLLRAQELYTAGAYSFFIFIFVLLAHDSFCNQSGGGLIGPCNISQRFPNGVHYSGETQIPDRISLWLTNTAPHQDLVMQRAISSAEIGPSTGTLLGTSFSIQLGCTRSS